MIKRLFTSVLIILFLMGCAGGQINQNAATLTAIELGGYNLGYYVGKSKTTSDDEAIAAAYKLARTGQLPAAEVAAAFAKFKIENAQLAGSLGIILKNMGASFDPSTGNLIDLSGIPVEYWDKAAEGYALGYEFGKAGQKDISGISAIVQFLPKKK